MGEGESEDINLSQVSNYAVRRSIKQAFVAAGFGNTSLGEYRLLPCPSGTILKLSIRTCQECPAGQSLQVSILYGRSF